MSYKEHGVPRKARRHARQADHDLKCTRCLNVIPAGTTHVTDATGATQHPDCARRRITPDVPREAPRTWLSPIPPPEPRGEDTCPGCERVITREDWPTSVPAFGLRWHRDCRLRQQQGGASH